MGAASRWRLHHSLSAFQHSLRSVGLRLTLRKGKALAALSELLKETGAGTIFFNRCYNPLDDAVLKELPSAAFHGSLLFEPGSICTKEGNPFQVFTPFYNACKKHDVPKPIAAPKRVEGKQARTVALSDLGLLPKIPWDRDFDKSAGEEAALAKLSAFLRGRARSYKSARDFPALQGSSLLSAHLHFGEISPRTIWHRAKGHEPFLRQIVWRDFASHLLAAFPKTPLHALHEKYEHFPWKKNARLLRLWQKGATGYPIVDAGMRQLWKTGWMHNRVRMIAASFLVKDLMIPWQEGAKWFWETLVDADLPNNTLGWQWVAGCGADAAPFFRIFNPVLQGEKFDPEGKYVRKYIPELARLPEKWVHRPWEAPAEVLEKAGVVLGKTYPRPVVDHTEARDEALKAYRGWK